MSNSTKTFSSIQRLTPSEALELQSLISDGQIKSVLVGKLLGANFNSTIDQAVVINNTSKYIVRSIVVTNASVSLTTAAGGIYTAASKGGSPLVASGQTYTALTSSSKYKELTLQTIVTTDVRTESVLYLSLTTPQGAAATADVYIYADMLD